MINQEQERWTQFIRNRALELGFDAIGFAQATYLEDDDRRLSTWLEDGRNGTMSWMENNHEKRVDPRLLVPGTQSVISLLVSYHRKDEPSHINQGVSFARYAQGQDYHRVIKKKLKRLYQQIQQEIPIAVGRYFVDSAPVLERSWAQRSGLGWIGKNGNLINKKLGSYFFIADILLNIPLVYDHATSDHCGTCRRCIDACPTDAIYEPKKVDGSKCISHWNIEHDGEIPKSFHEKMGEWIFGCDICQEVCPWNRKALLGHWPEFQPNEHWITLSPQEWTQLKEEEYEVYFNGTAVLRVNYKDFLRNAGIVLNNHQ